MDLDCLASLILVKKLFPDYRLVRSKLIHPVAQNLYYFYEMKIMVPPAIKKESC
jgi:tRNA nucleotidyltransferase (CCA-adding enzyme)